MAKICELSAIDWDDAVEQFAKSQKVELSYRTQNNRWNHNIPSGFVEPFGLMHNPTEYFCKELIESPGVFVIFTGSDEFGGKYIDVTPTDSITTNIVKDSQPVITSTERKAYRNSVDTSISLLRK